MLRPQSLNSSFELCMYQVPEQTTFVVFYFHKMKSAFSLSFISELLNSTDLASAPQEAISCYNFITILLLYDLHEHRLSGSVSLVAGFLVFKVPEK